MPALDPLPRLGANVPEACFVFAQETAPVEALSWVDRLVDRGVPRVQFVSLPNQIAVDEHVRAFVTRLSLARHAERILHAWWTGGTLEVLTTSFERFALLHRSIPELRGIPWASCRELEVTSDGDRIVWPREEHELMWERLTMLARASFRRRLRSPKGLCESAQE